MFMYDISIECRGSDVHSLRRWEEDMLRVILFRDGGDGWAMITLERNERTAWAQPFGFLQIPQQGSDKLWITATSESGIGIGHTTCNADGIPSIVANKVNEATLDVDKGRLSLTLRWTWSSEAPRKGLLSTEVVVGSILRGYAGYFDRRAYEAVSVAQSSPAALPWIAISIPAWQRIADEGDDSNPEFPDFLLSLATALHERHKWLGDPKDLDQCIEAHECCVQCTPEDDDMLPARLYQLGLELGIRFGYRDTLPDLEKSITLFHRAIDLLAPGQHPPFRMRVLGEIGRSYRRRFGVTGDIAFVQQSISTLQFALKIMPEGYPDHASLLADLGTSFKTLSEVTDDVEHTTSAISTLQSALALTPTHDPNLTMLLTRLAAAFEDRFALNEDLADIQSAVSTAQHAVDFGIQNGLPLTSSLSILSECLRMRSRYTGEKLDITSTLEAMEVDLGTLRETDPDLPGALDNLANMMRQQVRLGGSEVYLQRAIDIYKRAIALSANGRTYILPSLFNSLSGAYLERFDMTQDAGILRDAVEAKRKAIGLLPEGHADLPLFLNSLQRTLQIAFEAIGLVDDINEAIQCGIRATTVGPAGHAGLHLWWDQLGRSYGLRFDHTNDIADLDAAISAKERAVTLLPANSIVAPVRQMGLADYYIKRYEADNSNESNLLLAVAHYRRSALASVGYTENRLYSARNWARYARSIDLQSSLEGYDRAISLVQVFVGLEQTQERRHEHIGAISQLSVSAAATAFEAGKAEKALQWLEEGRCLVWSRLNSLRTPLDDLKDEDEELAGRILEVSKALEDSGAGDGRTRINVDKERRSVDFGRKMQVGREHVDLTVEWKRLVSEVRAKPGFEDFLQTRPIESILRDLPQTGTVVVINVHSSRCDALALRAGWAEPMHIPLPTFSLDKARRMSKQLRAHLGLGGVRMRGYEDATRDQGGEDDDEERAIRRMVKGPAQYKLVDTLRELWTSVVKPIFEAIGYLEEAASLHRVWWCPTGPLSSLPLHAAGTYKGGHDTTGDYAISSYIPNVNILLKQVQSSRTSSKELWAAGSLGVFVLSQPKTPGHTPLPGTTREVKAVQGVFDLHGVRNVHFEGEQATLDSSMEQMVLCRSVHFACHGFQDPKEPLASGFFLHDGRLQLSRVIKNNLKDAEVAFLSACQTSTGDEKLSEEAVHLAAGMVAAGYRGVVATMWSIRDQYAPEIAVDLYTELLRLNSGGLVGEGDIGAQNAAKALHYAVGKLRTKLGDKEEALFTWVPYVYFGI